MRHRNVTLLAVAVVALLLTGTTAAITYHLPLRLGREVGAPTPGPVVSQPAPPPIAVAGKAAPGAQTKPVAATTPRPSLRPVAAPVSARAPVASPAANTYPGTTSCPDSTVPSTKPYAYECIHSDGSPVRWRATTLAMWTDGLTPAQQAALNAAASQWTAHTGIGLVSAASSASAQVVITEVPTLGALPALGADIVEYARTTLHHTGGYYDHATIQVADVPLLGDDTWLDTMLHELGHTAGLAHVVALDQIMRPVVGVPQTSYGSGDIAGLEAERPH